MLTYVADVFGHTLVVLSFLFGDKFKIQRGFFFCKVGIYCLRRVKSEKACINLSEQHCINLA